MNDQHATPTRPFLREPIPEIDAAAVCLRRAAEAHLAGQPSLVVRLLEESNDPAVRLWAESLWGKASKYAASGPINSAPSFRVGVKERMPDLVLQRELHQRDGYYCRFCGIPVVRKQVREYLRKHSPEVQVWGRY